MHRARIIAIIIVNRISNSISVWNGLVYSPKFTAKKRNRLFSRSTAKAKNIENNSICGNLDPRERLRSDSQNPVSLKPYCNVVDHLEILQYILQNNFCLQIPFHSGKYWQYLWKRNRKLQHCGFVVLLHHLCKKINNYCDTVSHRDGVLQYFAIIFDRSLLGSICDYF